VICFSTADDGILLYDSCIDIEHPSIQAALAQDFHLDRNELLKLWKPPFTAEDEEVIREAEQDLRRMFFVILDSGARSDLQPEGHI